ncbi:hypothetical protein [Shimazuella alba]|uniref:HNH endonuclease n=1 Tax=Shimazuella alba TaxID=2690964 RepID=A0A6I4VWP1_9BACL|nr:hypothetical protein [Shimazuella alba]MXQ55343.1 hypothetical protein [Shimazuella alba]
MNQQELRKEFNSKIRRRYFKEHKEICSRCGRYSEGIDLHYKIPLGEGGNNDF